MSNLVSREQSAGARTLQRLTMACAVAAAMLTGLSAGASSLPPTSPPVMLASTTTNWTDSHLEFEEDPSETYAIAQRCLQELRQAHKTLLLIGEDGSAAVLAYIERIDTILPSELHVTRPALSKLADALASAHGLLLEELRNSSAGLTLIGRETEGGEAEYGLNAWDSAMETVLDSPDYVAPASTDLAKRGFERRNRWNRA